MPLISSKQIQKLQQPNIHISILHQVKPTYTYEYTYKKNTPATQHKLQKPKFTQFKPQQMKSEKTQYQSYKHNTAIATQQKPTCEKVKQILKLSTQLSNSSQQVPFQYSIIISKLNPITLYI